MTLTFVFWFFMLCWLVFGFFWTWPSQPAPSAPVWYPFGGSMLIFILFFLLGLQVFGWPIKG